MSLISAMNNATSSMRTIQTDMQVISGNVSNAGVEGYTRKKLNLSPDVNGLDGGAGVRIIGYQRSTSDAVSKLLSEALSNDGLYNTQKDYLSSIQNLLGSTQSSPGLSQTLSDFSAAWKSLAASPEDTTAKQEVIYKAQNLTREVARLANGLDKIIADAKIDMTASVNDLNVSLARIQELNNEISAADAANQNSGNMQDERDEEIQKISALLKITVVVRPNNQVAIFTPGGSSLLDNSPNTYTWNGTAILSNGVDVTAVLKGGKIEGLVGVLDQGSSAAVLNDPGKATVYKINEQLDMIVDLLANAANSFATAYDSATTGAGELASSFFTGTTRYNFALNTALANGTSAIKIAAATPVADDLNLANRSISAGNLSTTNVSYETFANAMISAQNQNAKQVGDQADIFSSLKDNYDKRLKDDTGVNVDEEIVRLTQLQNNYAASARVISTVKQMFDIINSLFG
ncbi:MAG: flagellar hook-associated protein FlgK [Alphaproteobacteria bacterium]|nr:flagellar hook-associated protein FlgK [Alphaproteobacteria bacterium]